MSTLSLLPHQRLQKSRRQSQGHDSGLAFAAALFIAVLVAVTVAVVIAIPQVPDAGTFFSMVP